MTQNKMDELTSIVDYNQDEYHKKRHPELIGADELSIAWSHFADYAYFSDVKQGETILEFGGGMANNLITVAKRAKVVMVEPAPMGRKIAESFGIEALETTESLSPKSFNCILCRHVLEHVDLPLTTLVTLRRLLRDDGKLIVAVPVESPTSPVLSSDLNHHLHTWNPQTIYNLMIRSGFKSVTVRFEYFGGRRLLLPVYRSTSGAIYARTVRLLGRLFRFREIVATGTM